jgi:hypothetical protein
MCEWHTPCSTRSMVSFEEDPVEADGFASLRIHQMIEEVLAELRSENDGSGTMRESSRDTFVDL